MLSLFVGNKRGTITVMLSFLLIAVLSINATFLETSRYQALKRLYKEMEENAIFSTLSQYDRDLYKNFGLLAIDQNADKETYMQYLKSCMNCSLDSANGADHLFDINAEDINFEKIYALSQSDIFKEQVDEFCSYRAPVYILDEVLNLEDALKDLLKKLEGMIPFLNVLKDVMKQAERLVELQIALDEYSDSSKKLKTEKEAYEKCVESYNNAVEAREKYKDSADDDHPIDEKKLDQLNKDIETKAGEVKTHIESLKTSLSQFYEKNRAFYKAYHDFQGGGMQAALDKMRAEMNNMDDAVEKESTKQMADSMQTAYDSSKEQCGKISTLMDKLTELDILMSQDGLTDQYNDLNGKTGEELGRINAVKMTNGMSMMDIVQLVIETAESLAETIKKIGEALGIIGECIQILKILGTGATYEPEYNNIVTRDQLGNLEKTQQSAYNENDRTLKEQQIRQTDEVARSLNFDTGIFAGSAGVPDNNTLQNALEATTNALDEFLTKIQDLNTSKTFIISQILARITAAISCVVILIEAVINLAEVAAAIMSGQETISSIIFRKMSSAVYANAMFSNRTTNIASDKRLNGSSYAYYSALFDEGACFDMANTEYVISGGISEMANQKTVFNLMLAIRVICNIPAVLNNDVVMSVIKTLGSTGILIPVAVIIFFIVLIIEAYLDMIFVIYTPDGVEFIKTKGYLDFTNVVEIKEYFRQIKVVIQEIQVRQTAFSSSVEYSETEITSTEYSVEVTESVEVNFSKDFNKKFQSLTKNTISKEDIKKQNQKILEETKIKQDEKKGQNTGEKGKKIDINKWAEDYKSGLTKANYSDHMLLLMVLLISNDKLYSRCADLITMQMRQIKRGKGDVQEFNLKNMATYVRVESTAHYKPLLPIPVVPGLNDDGIPMKSIHYNGY